MSEPTRPPTAGGAAGSSPAGEYEIRVITLLPHVSRSEARQLLTEHAEYGRWELARVLLFAGGTRRVWLRRKIIRVARSA